MWVLHGVGFSKFYRLNFTQQNLCGIYQVYDEVSTKNLGCGNWTSHDLIMAIGSACFVDSSCEYIGCLDRVLY
jgi:hypothetical protein